MNMWKKLLFVYLTVISCIFIATGVSAQSVNSLAQKKLLEQVTTHVIQQVNPDNSPDIAVRAVPLDSRIRVNYCPIPLRIEVKQRSRYTRQFPVKVSCETDQDFWKLFVQVVVTEYIETLVSNQQIAKGDVISADMVRMAKIEKHRIKARSENIIDKLVGGRAMRNIPNGYQVSAQDVCLVCKGDEVSIVAKSENLVIKTTGTAIENGSFGQSIRVKNNNSERIVKGVIGDLREIYVKI